MILDLALLHPSDLKLEQKRFIHFQLIIALIEAITSFSFGKSNTSRIERFRVMLLIRESPQSIEKRSALSWEIDHILFQDELEDIHASIFKQVGMGRDKLIYDG